MPDYFRMGTNAAHSYIMDAREAVAAKEFKGAIEALERAKTSLDLAIAYLEAIDRG